MSIAFASVRIRAVEIAKQELASNVRENNNYQAIKDLHLGQGVLLENRGERVDDYLINAGVSPATMVLQGEIGAKMREWCGMFVYYCYSTALKQTANAGALPFRSTDLWSGPRLRTWAINYDIWQAQRYILNHSVLGEQVGGETLDLINQQPGTTKCRENRQMEQCFRRIQRRLSRGRGRRYFYNQEWPYWNGQ